MIWRRWAAVRSPPTTFRTVFRADTEPLSGLEVDQTACCPAQWTRPYRRPRHRKRGSAVFHLSAPGASVGGIWRNSESASVGHTDVSNRLNDEHCRLLGEKCRAQACEPKCPALPYPRLLAALERCYDENDTDWCSDTCGAKEQSEEEGQYWSHSKPRVSSLTGYGQNDCY